MIKALAYKFIYKNGDEQDIYNRKGIEEMLFLNSMCLFDIPYIGMSTEAIYRLEQSGLGFVWVGVVDFVPATYEIEPCDDGALIAARVLNDPCSILLESCKIVWREEGEDSALTFLDDMTIFLEGAPKDMVITEIGKISDVDNLPIYENICMLGLQNMTAEELWLACNKAFDSLDTQTPCPWPRNPMLQEGE